MKFGDALTAMQNGLKVYRPAWDQSKALEPGAYLTIGAMQDPQAPGGSRDVIMYHPGESAKVSTPWLHRPGGMVAIDDQVLAEDWEIRK
jgi:hypothetical protein